MNQNNISVAMCANTHLQSENITLWETIFPGERHPLYDCSLENWTAVQLIGNPFRKCLCSIKHCQQYINNLRLRCARCMQETASSDVVDLLMSERAILVMSAHAGPIPNLWEGQKTEFFEVLSNREVVELKLPTTNCDGFEFCNRKLLLQGFCEKHSYAFTFKAKLCSIHLSSLTFSLCHLQREISWNEMFTETLNRTNLTDFDTCSHLVDEEMPFQTHLLSSGEVDILEPVEDLKKVSVEETMLAFSEHNYAPSQP